MEPDRFSASDAALEGFQLLRRHWRVVLGWAGFNLMALVAMVVVTVIVMLVVTIATGGGADGATSSVGGAVGTVVGLLGTLLVEAIIVSALLRLLLRQEEPGFFYLRCGRDELRLLLLWLNIVALSVVMLFPIIGLVATANRAGLFPAIAVGFAGAAAVAWIWTRLSLSEPATFAERRLGLVTSWRLSRGRFWPLFGMLALRLCLMAMVLVVAWFALFLLTAALSGFRDFSLPDFSDEAAVTEHPLRFILQLAAQVVFAPAWLTIAQAPLVAAYKALTPGGEPARPIGPGGPWGAANG